MHVGQLIQDGSVVWKVKDLRAVATASENGMMSAADKAKLDKISLTATSTQAGIVKLYSSVGNNTDGTMTQSAFKSAFDNKLDASSWKPFGYSDENSEGTAGYVPAPPATSDTKVLTNTGWADAPQSSPIIYLPNVPTQTGSITYDGTPKTPTWKDYDSEKLQISGDYENIINAGTYQAGFTPMGIYTWMNGTQEMRYGDWVIQKAVGNATLSATSGTVQIDSTVSFNVNRSGDGTVTATSNDTSIATVSVSGTTVTVTGKAAGNAAITISVAEGTNHLAVENDLTYQVTVNKIPLSLSASISGSVTYNTTGNITISGNSGSGAVTAISNNTNSVTVSDTTAHAVTVKCVNYESTTTKITINVAETTKYQSGTTTCNVTTAKADGSVSLSASSGTVTYGTPSTFTINTNISGGALSVSSADINYATASLNGTTVTVNCVKYRSNTTVITVTSAATDNYNEASTTYTMTAAKANGSITLSASSGTVTYGTPSTFTINTNISSGTLSVSSADTNYATASLSGSTVTVTCASYRSTTTVITVTSAETNNYKAATATYTMTAAKANGSITLSASSGTVQIDSTVSFTLSDKAGDGEVTATSNDNDIATVSVSGTTVTVTGKGAGNATITVQVAAGTNHKAISKTYTISVTKIPLSLSTSISGAVTYNTTGTINITGNLGGGTVTASSNNATYVNSTTTTTSTVVVKCLKFTSSVTTITVNVAETTKYQSGTTTCDVTTSKADGSVNLSSTSGTVTYGTPSTFTVTGNTSSGTLSVSSANTDYATASLNGTTVTVNCVKYRSTTTVITVTSAATDNYNEASATYTMTAAKANGTFTLSVTSMSFSNKTLSGTSTVNNKNSTGAISATSNNTNVATVSVSGTTITVTGKAAGSATITVTVAADDNINEVSKTIAVTSTIVGALNTCTAAKIQAIAAAGNGADYWAVGDMTAAVKMNGKLSTGLTLSNYDAYFYIIGFSHNKATETLNNGSQINTIHFQFGKNASGAIVAFIDDHYGSGTNMFEGEGYFRHHTTNTSAGGWKSSDFRTKNCVWFYNALPSEWRNIIKPIRKYSDNTGGGDDNPSYVTATCDNVWLLAEFEVYGARGIANSAEQNYQRQYDYYKTNSAVVYGHSGGRLNSIYGGAATRSFRPDHPDGVCFVRCIDGNGDEYSWSAHGFGPAFAVG